MARRPKLFYVGLTVLGTLARLIWFPGLWKALYLWRKHLVSISKSRHVPGIYYSQDAEDISLNEILPEIGFYVDVGAHHPERFSVTKLLYEKGWSGINVDVTSAIKEDFPHRRSRDTNVEALIGAPGEVDFYRFKEEALNTTSRERASFLISLGEKLVSTETLPVKTLTEVLAIHGSPVSVDFLNVDVEGADLAVLNSLDWNKYAIQAVLIEIGKPVWDLMTDEVTEFLESKGLKPTLCFTRSVLFLSVNHAGNDLFRK